MTSRQTQPAGKPAKIAAWVMFAMALGIAAQGLFLLFLGFDKENFAEVAGIEWDAFAAESPEAAAQLEKGGTDRVYAVTALGLGLQSAALVYLPLRRRKPSPTPLLMLLPAVIIGWGLVLLPAGNTAIAFPSIVAGVITAAALYLGRPALQPQTLSA